MFSRFSNSGLSFMHNLLLQQPTDVIFNPCFVILCIKDIICLCSLTVEPSLCRYLTVRATWWSLWFCVWLWASCCVCSAAAAPLPARTATLLPFPRATTTQAPRGLSQTFLPHMNRQIFLFRVIYKVVVLPSSDLSLWGPASGLVLPFLNRVH